MTKGVNTRAIVLDMLLEITAGQAYSHVVIKNVLDKYNYLEPREKAFLKRLTEGTLERQIQLDYILDAFSSTPVNRMKPVIRCILRMGVYQLLFMDGIPDSAVCNEAVRLAEKRKFFPLKGFVNGVLRTVAREKERIVYPDRESEPKQYLSVVYSMPEWIVEMWLSDYGFETTEKLLKALLLEHPVTIRLKETMEADEREAVLSEFAQKGIEVRQHPYLSYAYTLHHPEGVTALKSFAGGAFYVQDVSSMFVAECAGIQAGDYVLDVCAAPGGKSLHAAEKLLAAEKRQTAKSEAAGRKGLVEARDVSGEKADKIRENVQRLQLENVKVCVQDAGIPDEASREKADILFLDIPCSGLGVIGKKRDIKYKVRKEQLTGLAELQKSILRACLPYVKHGGTVLFSTCTIHREENEELLSWICREFAFVPVSLDEHLPKELQSETTAKGYLQFLPGIHATDGFFLAKLKRK